MKLNLGCGTDIRPGFVNIDASSTLPGIDQNIDLSLPGALLEYFKPNTVDFVLANDIIEHLFHWEAVSLLKDIYAILKPGASVTIRVPDCKRLILDCTDAENAEHVLTMLFGGQDVPQGNPEMDKSRQRNPSLFCHKYGWTWKRMRSALNEAGFKDHGILFYEDGTNFQVTAKK